MVNLPPHTAPTPVVSTISMDWISPMQPFWQKDRNSTCPPSHKRPVFRIHQNEENPSGVTTRAGFCWE